MSKLKDEESPCLPPHISMSALSALELRTIIIEGLKVNRAWNRPGGTLLPTSTKELRLPEDPSSSQDQGKTLRDIRLLPGAKHVLIEHDKCIEIWDIGKDVKIGSTPPCLAYDLCLTFDVEIVRGGEELIIAGIFINIETCRRSVYMYLFSY